MYCAYCGIQIPENTNVCPGCHNAVATNTQTQHTSPISAPSDVITKTSPVATATPSVNATPVAPATPVSKAKTSGIALPLYIALGVVAVIFIVVSVLFFTNMPFNSASSFSDSSYNVTCASVPETTNADSIVLSGTATSKGTNSNLVLNGEFIDSVSSKDREKVWSKTVYLEPGMNTFILTLTDNQGKSQTKVLNIEKTVPLKYEPGTVFVKSNPSEIYIRPTPQISDKFVVLISAYDYTSRFTSLGEEYTDTSGYVWCKVSTPSNGIGWVRTDLVKVLH